MKAIIFDLDGTLVYTEKECRHRLVAQALEHFGKTAPESEMNEFWFMHGRNEMIRKWGLDPDEFWAYFNQAEFVEERLMCTAPFDDVEFLKELHKDEIKLAILTGAPPGTAEFEIAMLPDVFDAIVIADPNGDVSSKPDPEGVHEGLRQLGTDIHETVYIGNSDEDILTAKNAGIYSVLIDRGEHSHSLKPDKVIKSLYEIANL